MATCGTSCGAVTSAIEDDFDEQEAAEKQRLKAALHYSVGKVCEDVQNECNGYTISKDVMAAITELAIHQCETLSTDLELFAKHAKRTTINIDDLKLCCRHNPSLLKYITDEAEELKKEKTQSEGEKKRKREKKIVIEDDDD